MQAKKDNSSEKIFPRIIQLLEKYPNAYTDEEISFIINNFDWINYNKHYNYILREIYDELGVIKEEDNLYIGFINLIEKKFGLDKKIVEIGGGILPNLSKRIALRQEKGNITVFDPRLATTNTTIPNLKLIKEKFDKTKALDNRDLYIGFQPYGGTKAIIETACKNNTDFIIAIGDLPNENNSFIDEDDYDIVKQHLIYDAKKLVNEYGIGKLEITNLEEYGSIHPVIYNKRIK